MRNQIKLAVIAASTLGGFSFCAAPGFADDASASMSMDQCALHDNLVKQLTMIVDHESDWPTDVNAAYGVVGHHIIEAMYDIDGMKKMASAK